MLRKLLLISFFLTTSTLALRFQSTNNSTEVRNLQTQSCIQTYNNLFESVDYKSIENSNTPWIDPDFTQNQALAQQSGATFVSASSLNLYQIFGNQGIKPSDVQQGALGNCYILSVIQSMAQHSSNLQKVFVNGQNSGRIYVTQWYIGGKKIEVAVDDRFAANQYGQWAYVKMVNDNELWPFILEKAWAKLSGSYKNTESGWPSKVFHTLTGAPVVNFYHSRIGYHSLFDLVLSSDKVRYPMNLAAIDNTCGIVDNHAYSLMGAYQNVRASDGNYYDLVKIRNPHNQNSWSGKFSDNSYLWTQSLKTQYGVGTDPGVFFMDKQTYHSCFYATIFNVLKSGYENSYREFYDVGSAIKRFKISNGRSFAVSVYFMNERFLQGNNSSCKSSKSRSLLSLYKVDSSNNKSLVGQTSDDGLYDSIIVGSGKSGEYQARVSVSWDSSVQYLRNFQINVYSEESISFYDENEGSYSLVNFLNLTFIALIIGFLGVEI